MVRVVPHLRSKAVRLLQAPCRTIKNRVKAKGLVQIPDSPGRQALQALPLAQSLPHRDQRLTYRGHLQ